MQASATASTEPCPLIAFDRRHRRLCASIALIFLLALLFRIHGWSTPIWHNVIDGSRKSEILWGHARDIRSDDYMLDLPMMLAQTAHQPSFPIVNDNIGTGMYMPAPIRAPARDSVILLYRPFTWGFWLGNDVGLSWLWWGLTLGLFYSFFLVFLLVSRNLFWVSLWAALALVFSPYFQFWSLHKAEIAIHWAGAFVAGAYLVSARKGWVIWCAGAFLGWSVSGMALDHIYPPIAVTVGWLLPFAATAWCWDRRKILPFKEHVFVRVAAFVLAVAITGASLGIFFRESRGVAQIIQHTVYPGQRFTTGGGFPLWAFLSHDLLAESCNHPGSWIGNICEDSSFIFIFPAIWIMLAILLVQHRKWMDSWSLVLAGYIALVMTYTYAGFPAWLARLTLFGMSTDNRTQMGLGLADLLILVAAVSNARLRDSLRVSTRWIGLLLWVGLLIAYAFWFKSHWPGLKWTDCLIGIALQVLLACLLWSGNLRSWGMAVLAAFSFAYTIKFNPWVAGGSDFFFKNPLSAKILELDRADHHTHAWVVIGDNGVINLPRIIGVKSLGGYHGYPDFPLLKLFDPAGRYYSTYNQCGWLVFRPAASMDAEFSSPSPGLVVVDINPASSAFVEANVRFFLVADKLAIREMDQNHRFAEICRYADKAIFECKP